MALNLNTIKALFGKLAPYADDVARGVANYGDDAAKLVANYGDDAARAVANYGDDVSDIARPWMPNSTPGMVKRFEHVANNFVGRNRYPTSTPISSVDGLRDSSQKLLSLYNRLQDRVNLKYGLPPGTPLDTNLEDRIFNTSLRFPKSVEVNSLYKDVDLSDILDPRVPRTYF